MTMHTSPLGKLRSIVVIICLLVILGIFGYAYLTTLGDTVLDKDTVTEKTENLKNDPDYNYVSSYLRECGIGNIKESKINNIENILENNFYKDLPDEKELHLTTMRVGDVVFAGFPGEPFTEMGRQVKSNSPFTLTIPSCCTNGHDGYYPTADAFAENGYEANASRYVAGTAEKLLEASLETIKSLK